jgi:uncharacterized membrane protein YbhN (UPF0104 family)
MAKKIVLNAAKVILAAGLLWWLVDSGKLDWEMLLTLRRYPHRLLLAFGFCFLNLLLVTVRWRFILAARTESAPMPLRKLFLVNWIGMFFSTVLPGSVTGDVVKVFYVRRQHKELSHAFLLFSCLLDRVMGLTGLILLMGVFSVANYSALVVMSPRLSTLLGFNFMLLGAVVGGLLAYFFLPAGWQARFEAWARARPKAKLPLRVAELWRDLTAVRGRVALAVAISVAVQFLSVVIFYLLVSPQFVTGLSLPMVLSFIPLGFMAIALPISPAGLGVGHAAFEALFAFAGEPGGANFFNMYFVVMLTFNLLGALPWLAWRHKAPEAP